MRIILPLILTALTNSLVGQVCTPDGAATTPGLHPDSATGIPPAFEQQYYSTTITVVIPDTVVVNIAGPQTVDIDSVVLDEVIGLPGFMTLSCEPAGCAFPGNSIGCALFEGTPPLGSADTIPMDIVTTAYGKISAFPVSLKDTAEGRYTLIIQGTSFSIEKNAPTFQVYPNPSTGAVTIETPAPDEVLLIDLFGQAHERYLIPQSGTHQVRIKPGLWFVQSLTNNTTQILQVW